MEHLLAAPIAKRSHRFGHRGFSRNFYCVDRRYRGLRRDCSFLKPVSRGGRSALHTAPTRLAERDKLSRSISRGGQSRDRNASKVVSLLLIELQALLSLFLLGGVFWRALTFVDVSETAMLGGLTGLTSRPETCLLSRSALESDRLVVWPGQTGGSVRSLASRRSVRPRFACGWLKSEAMLRSGSVCGRKRYFEKIKKGPRGNVDRSHSCSKLDLFGLAVMSLKRCSDQAAPAIGAGGNPSDVGQAMSPQKKHKRQEKRFAEQTSPPLAKRLPACACEGRETTIKFYGFGSASQSDAEAFCRHRVAERMSPLHDDWLNGRYAQGLASLCQSIVDASTHWSSPKPESTSLGAAFHVYSSEAVSAAKAILLADSQLMNNDVLRDATECVLVYCVENEEKIRQTSKRLVATLTSAELALQAVVARSAYDERCYSLHSTGGTASAFDRAVGDSVLQQRGCLTNALQREPNAVPQEALSGWSFRARALPETAKESDEGCQRGGALAVGGEIAQRNDGAEAEGKADIADPQEDGASDKSTDDHEPTVGASAAFIEHARARAMAWKARLANKQNVKTTELLAIVRKLAHSAKGRGELGKLAEAHKGKARLRHTQKLEAVDAILGFPPPGARIEDNCAKVAGGAMKESVPGQTEGCSRLVEIVSQRDRGGERDAASGDSSKDEDSGESSDEHESAGVATALDEARIEALRLKEKLGNAQNVKSSDVIDLLQKLPQKTKDRAEVSSWLTVHLSGKGRLRESQKAAAIDAVLALVPTPLAPLCAPKQHEDLLSNARAKKAGSSTLGPESPLAELLAEKSSQED